MIELLEAVLVSLGLVVSYLAGHQRGELKALRQHVRKEIVIEDADTVRSAVNPDSIFPILTDGEKVRALASAGAASICVVGRTGCSLQRAEEAVDHYLDQEPDTVRSR